MPRVSVVIAAFNAEPYLGQTLDSVLGSTFRDFEVLVIDDGSKDRTAEVAAAYGSPVRVISQANAGMSASRNRGIAEARGEYVALLDSDDLWHPQKLELQVHTLQDDPAAGLCFTEFLRWTGLDEPAFSGIASTELDAGLSGWLYHKMVLTNWVLPSSTMLRRTVFERAGPFLCENQQTDDWEYFVRISRDWKFLKLKAALVAYRQTPGSLSRRVTPENVGEAMRERLISRFGVVSPQGAKVDEAELTRRRHKGRLDFADAHISRGSLAIGAREAQRMLLQGPFRARTTVVLLNSLRRRYFPKATDNCPPSSSLNV